MLHSIRAQRWLGRAASAGALGALAILAEPARATEVVVRDDLGLWAAAAAMAEGDPEQALARADAIAGVLRGVAAGIRMDDRSVTLMQDSRDAAMEMNLGRLHEMLPEEDGEVHRLRAQGRSLYAGASSTSSVRDAIGYRYTLFPTSSELARPRGFLDFDAETLMSPAEHDFGPGQGYRVHQAAELGMGAIRHSDVAAAAEAALIALERAATGPSDPSRLAVGRRLEPGLAATTDLALVGLVGEAAPGASATLARFVDVTGVGTAADGTLDLDWRVRLDAEALEAAGYRDLARQAARMGDVIRLDLRVRDAHGHELARAELRSADLSLRLVASVRDGGLVPRNAAGARLVDQVVHPTDPVIDLRLGIDGEVRMDGILLRLSGYRIPIVYWAEGEGGASVAVDIKSEPKIELTGTGAVTTWFAELADSALNLEAQGQVMFRAVANGSDGSGSKARMHYVNGVSSSIATSVDMMLVDNALVRFGMKMAGRHLAPSDDAVSDAVQLFSALIRELDADYRAMRPGLAREG